MLTGSAYRLSPAFANNVGWTGLLVALVARNDAGAAIATALLFGALAAGGSFLSTAGPSTDLVSIVQALVVLGVVFPPAFVQLRRIHRDHAASARTIAIGSRRELHHDHPVERGAPERAAVVRGVRRIRRGAGGNAQHLGRGDDALRRVRGSNRFVGDAQRRAGLMWGAAIGLLIGLIHGNLSHRLHTNTFVVGITLNVLALGR